MCRTPAVRVKTQERCTAVGLGDAFVEIGGEIDPVGFDREAKVGVRLDDRQRFSTNEDGFGEGVERGWTSKNEAALFDIHSYAGLTKRRRRGTLIPS